MRSLAIILVAACGSSPPRLEVRNEPTPAAVESQQVDREDACWRHVTTISLFTSSTESDRAWQATFQQRALSRICAVYESPDDDREIALRVTDVAARARSIEALRRTPAAIECARVAEQMHNEASWRATGSELQGAWRTALARTQHDMAAACTNDAWSDWTRACLVAGADERTCTGELRWTPWRLKFKPPPECHEYERVVRVLQRCTTVSKEERDEADDWLETVREHWFEMDGDGLDALPLACEGSALKTRKRIAAAGC